MPILGINKQKFLNQVRDNRDNKLKVNAESIKKALATYEDLQLGDLKDCISDPLYHQIEEGNRDPEEVRIWQLIATAPQQTPQHIQEKQRWVSKYLEYFPKGPKAVEVQKIQQQLKEALEAAMRGQKTAEETNLWNAIAAMPISSMEECDAVQVRLRTYFDRYASQGQYVKEANKKQQEVNERKAFLVEQKDWEHLDRGNYAALKQYKERYPQSVHWEELDDLMWMNTKNHISVTTLSRYCSDWPQGKYASQATEGMRSYGEWEEVKHKTYNEPKEKLFAVNDFKEQYPYSPFIHEVNAMYHQLKDGELESMKKNPSQYSKDDVTKFMDKKIFSKWDLIDQELMTEESWMTLQGVNREDLPDIQSLQLGDTNIQSVSDSTDIYLFGTPGTGKTCLLMGLAGANGKDYSLNMRMHGGPYASALQEYVQVGVTPGRTFGSYVTTIHGQINDETRKGRIVSRKINLVEMSGEEFAIHIADSKEVSFSDMGTGVTNLLSNDNDKVFFIIVDASSPRVKFQYIDDRLAASGDDFQNNIRTRYISQLDILNKFAGLLTMKENESVMRRVKAIHFIVTKADVLGDGEERLKRAYELLKDMYAGPVAQIKNYCLSTRRINESTKYVPHVFTFSLGKFYLGDVFKFDSSETLNIIDTLRGIIAPRIEDSWLSRVWKKIN